MQFSSSVTFSVGFLGFVQVPLRPDVYPGWLWAPGPVSPEKTGFVLLSAQILLQENCVGPD